MHLLSNYVADLVYERISLHNGMKICDSIDSLLSKPNAHGLGAKLFEMAVHHAFRKGITFKPLAMDGAAPSPSMRIKKAE